MTKNPEQEYAESIKDIPWLQKEYLAECEKDQDCKLYCTINYDHNRPQLSHGLYGRHQYYELRDKYAAIKWAKENGKEYLL